MQVVLKHRDFKEPVTAMLKSDAKGRVVLGELKDIVSVTATGLGGPGHVWQLPEDHHSYRSVIDAKAGDVVRIPWLGGALSRFEAAFFEVIDNTIVSDKFDALAVKDGLLEIADLKPGDYDLLFKASGERIRIRVVEGVAQSGWVLGQLRHLELAKLPPSTIASISTEGDSLTIKLKDASPFARVHVIASLYLPEYSAYADFAKVRDAELHGVYPGFADSVYLTGRAIGDEYRYVLDRKYQKKYPGNMLDRPQLLLNPWACAAPRPASKSRPEAKAMAPWWGQCTAAGGVATAHHQLHRVNFTN